MSGAPPDNLNDLSAQGISYELIPIEGDGWCLYRAYLTGIYGRDPSEGEITDFVTKHITKRIEKLPEEAQHTPGRVNDLIRMMDDAGSLEIKNSDGNPFVDISKNPYKGFALQELAGPTDRYVEVEKDTISGKEIQKRKYVEGYQNYGEKLSTFRDGRFSSGPEIWPTVDGLYLFFEQPIVVYSDVTNLKSVMENYNPSQKYVPLMHSGNHFSLIRLKGPTFPDWYFKPGENIPSWLIVANAGIVTTAGATPQPTADDTLTMDQIKQHLTDLSGDTDPRAKKLQIILSTILLINAIRERKQRQQLPQTKGAVKISDISGRMASIKPTRGMIEGAFNALGGFGKKVFDAAKGLRPASKPALPLRTGISALRTKGQADFSRAPATVQRIVSVPKGSYIQAGDGSATPKRDTGVPLIPDLPEFKAGSIVTTYIKVGDRLLIHRRPKGVADEQTISTPSGWVDASDGTYVAAAVREVKEESGLELVGETLTTLRVTQIDGKYMVAFYVERDALPDVPGPQPEFAKELDMKYDFAGIAGESAGPGHFWADIAELPKWLRTNKEFKNRMFYDNLVALMLHFPKAFKIPDDAANDVVYSIDALDQRLSWVPKKVFSSQDLKDTWLCQFEQTRVSPCEPWELRDALIAADKFKEHDRLGAHLATNPDIMEYREMTNRIKELKDTSKPHDKDAANELRTLEKEFSDKYLQMRKVHVMRSLKPDGDYSEETFSIPNPVHALSYREDEVTDFANPAGTLSKYDPSGAMLAMNTGVLKAIAYPEMIADKHMAISILESLWHCAGDVSLSSDPRCFPARVLGQLREYEAARVQLDQQQRARDYMKTRSAWPEIKRIIRALKNSLIGAQVVSFSDTLAKKIDVVTAAPNPADPPVPVVAGQPMPQSTAASTVATASTVAPAAITPSGTPGASKQPSQGIRQSRLPAMEHGVVVVIPRGIGAPFGFQSLLPQPRSIAAVGVSGR